MRLDLERYPLDTPGASAWTVAVEAARRQLEEHGWAELSGFVLPEGVEALVGDTARYSEMAWRSSGRSTPYLCGPDAAFPAGHPRRTSGSYSLAAVAYDLFPRDSLLRQLYEWEPLLRFLEAVLDRGSLFPYADPFGALNLAVMEEGDELQWHFDQTDFVVSLAIQTAVGGGAFEVAPRIRSIEDESYPEVASVLEDRSSDVVTLPMTPGTLLVFEGRHSLHRVTPVTGDTSRLVALLAYDTAPDRQGSDELRRSRYGRTVPFPEPPTLP